MHNLKVAVKIVIGFMFSITILIGFLVASLFGVEASDTVRLIVTEATGLRRDMVLFQAELMPLIFYNVFWVCLALLGFMLIFLFFVDHSFKALMGPGVLCIVISFFLAATLTFFYGYIFNNIDPVAEIYMKNAVERFTNTAIGTVSLGLLLVAASLWGDRLVRKASRQK